MRFNISQLGYVLNNKQLAQSAFPAKIKTQSSNEVTTGIFRGLPFWLFSITWQYLVLILQICKW